jgi:hypothetical protein
MTAFGVTTHRYRRVSEAGSLEFVNLPGFVAHSLRRSAIQTTDQRRGPKLRRKPPTPMGFPHFDLDTAIWHAIA